MFSGCSIGQCTRLHAPPQGTPMQLYNCSTAKACQQTCSFRHSAPPGPTQSAASRTTFQCNHSRSAAGRVLFSSSITAVSKTFPWTPTWPRHSQQHARHASHEAGRGRSVASRLLVAAGDETNAAGLGSCRGKGGMQGCQRVGELRPAR